jgi:KUP system potassium uptake protein
MSGDAAEGVVRTESSAAQAAVDGAAPRAAGGAALLLAALGVVYGDIGTSPLYAAKEVFNPAHGLPLTHDNILGGVSAILWALMIVVSFKYVILIMRADNKGEGGVMALLALAIASVRDRGRLPAALALFGIFGAALFYGDGIITPAISVLSAIEGLEVATPVLKPYIIPLTLVILTALFMLQRHGTSTVGALFGPVMVVWFLTLAAGGFAHVARAPAILHAVNPLHAWTFLTQHGYASFLVLGSVFLAVTGAEALYADMGHFGRRPIRAAWFGCVLPGLTLNYLGQGALLMSDPTALENPFYRMFPGWALYPMVVLSTAATVIASQAVITGAYSMTKQAIQLGFLPRSRILQTSSKEIGQIYLPSVNWILYVGIVAAVLGFGSSTGLASAYGISVSGTMLITTFLTFFVLRYGWHYSLALCLASTGFFILVDSAFLSANLAKIVEGGWFPLALGFAIFVVMTTWRRGRELLFEHLRSAAIPLTAFLQSLLSHPLIRVPGTAVFLTRDGGSVPHALLHNLAHNKILHESVVFVRVLVEEIPFVPEKDRIELTGLGHNCYQVDARFGFMDNPDVPAALALCAPHGLQFNPLETSFFLSRESVIASSGDGMALWRERLFAAMVRNSGSVVEYFNIPPNRVIELGTQVAL